jgi:hypothetical protein
MQGLSSAIAVDTDWVAFLVVAFGAITGALAFYIRTTVKNATVSINQLNGGSHLADLPAKVQIIEQKLDKAASEAAEAKITSQIVLKNQLELMAVLLPHEKRNIHE